MSAPGGFFEVTGKMCELDRIMDGIYENSGRLTSDESFTLDLWLEMKEEWFRLHDAEVRAGVVAEEPERRSLTPDEINALPIGSVVMTETNIATFGVYEQRVWQKFGGEPDWQFGMPRHEWQSTDGGFERVGNADRHRGQFGLNRRVTLLWVPVNQEGEKP